MVQDTTALGAGNQLIRPLYLNAQLGRNIHETAHAGFISHLGDSLSLIHFGYFPEPVH